MYFNAGINASLGLYGITQGKVVTVGDYSGNVTSYGTVTLDVNTFLNNVALSSTPSTALTQKFSDLGWRLKDLKKFY